MRQAVFVEKREAGWQRLERLLKEAERRGLRHLDPEAVSEIGTLYRWVTSDLAFAEGRHYDPSLRAYLNRLTARAHAVVYGGSNRGGWRRIFEFYAVTFPAEVRASAAPILACVAISVLTGLLAYYLIQLQPLNAYVVLPDEYVRPIREGLHKSNFEPAVRFLGSPALSAAIMTHNIEVSIGVFAGGIILAIPTVYLLIENGLMLGGLAALYRDAGYSKDFWATIAPHGIIELSAIQIAGAAGLLLAAGIVLPGRLRRADALRKNARRAGILVLGVASMLVVAGTIEGTFSPQNFSENTRLYFGAMTAAVMLIYFLTSGRRAQRHISQ